ncbi:MAG: NUDIX domain-containing protein [Asticcacaulis sp.]|nr:NUDIX domain-containing protein [Asticcacaulis sp.]
MTVQRLAVIRGRFAPLTLAALAAIEDALSDADRLVLLVAAAEQAPSCRLPWPVAARMEMAAAALAHFGDRVILRPVPDWRYDAAARSAAEAAAIAGLPGVVERLPDLPDEPELVAALFNHGAEAMQSRVPDTVMAAVSAFCTTDAFANLAEEYRYVVAYRRSWSVAPYPPVLVTVDTIIVHVPDGGLPHLLLIRRGAVPGRGTWALPGGFVDPGEWLIDAAFRELREETGLRLSDAEARAALKDRDVFDAPDRSSRARIVTHGFYFVVSGGPLPDVVGDDDAAEARWWPVADLHGLSGQMFEDHPDVIVRFLGPVLRP